MNDRLDRLMNIIIDTNRITSILIQNCKQMLDIIKDQEDRITELEKIVKGEAQASSFIFARDIFIPLYENNYHKEVFV